MGKTIYTIIESFSDEMFKRFCHTRRLELCLTFTLVSVSCAVIQFLRVSTRHFLMASSKWWVTFLYNRKSYIYYIVSCFLALLYYLTRQPSSWGGWSHDDQWGHFGEIVDIMIWKWEEGRRLRRARVLRSVSWHFIKCTWLITFVKWIGWRSLFFYVLSNILYE